MKPSYPIKKILIIGAGIAGLAACRRLKEKGFDVTILEARDRCGGRIWTDTSLGVPIGRGATFIHGNIHNPLEAISTTTPLQMIAIDQDKVIRLDQAGKEIPAAEVEKFRNKFDCYLQKADAYTRTLPRDISFLSALEHVINRAELTPIELELLDQKINYFERYLGESIQHISALHWNMEEHWPGDECFLTSTYQPLIESLQKDCPVELNTIVSKISIQKDGIEVVTDGNKIYTADAVILTVPLGVLKKNKIKFSPPLPPAKQAAIDQLEMGLLNFTALRFEEIFWPADRQIMQLPAQNKFIAPVMFNLQYFMQQPILLCFNGGEKARRLENFSDVEVVFLMMKDLKAIFGDAIPSPSSFFNTRWWNDPYSYGSYTYVPINADSSTYEAMAQPVGDRIFFAGEATSAKHFATTHGAYLSGLREADRILSMQLT